MCFYRIDGAWGLAITDEKFLHCTVNAWMGKGKLGKEFRVVYGTQIKDKGTMNESRFQAEPMTRTSLSFLNEGGYVNGHFWLEHERTGEIADILFSEDEDNADLHDHWFLGRWVVMPPLLWRQHANTCYEPASVGTQRPWIKFYQSKWLARYDKSVGYSVKYSGDAVVDVAVRRAA